MITDALRTREGSLYLGGAALVLLLDAFLLLSTINAFMAQEESQEAVQQFYRNEASAKGKLRALRDAGDPTASVLLGAWLYERATTPEQLETAQRCFEGALTLEPGRNSAAVGLAAVKLRLGESGDVKKRRAAAGDAETALQQANDGGHPDVAYLKGAIAIFRGKHQAAIEILEKDPEVAPSLEGLGARHWNLGVARTLARRNDAFEAQALGYLLRRWPIPAEFTRELPEDPRRRGEPEKLLLLSIQLSLADPSSKPADKASLLKRCEAAKRLCELVFSPGRGMSGGQRGRFLPHSTRVPVMFNAIGVGYYRAEEFELAQAMFERASKGRADQEPLYLLNMGQAAWKAAQSKKVGSTERQELLDKAEFGFTRVAEMLGTQKGREAQVRLALTNACVVMLQTKSKVTPAVHLFKAYQKQHPSQAEWNRNMGVLWDHAGQGARCMPYYRKAIELGHKDIEQMQSRLGHWEARQ